MPEWLDRVLSTPLLRMVPASMLTVTSRDSYVNALKDLDAAQTATAINRANDVLVGCVERNALGGFSEGLKGLPPHLQRVAIRHVINGWRQYKMDPRAKALRNARRMKDPQLRLRALEWINDGMRYGD